MRRYDWERRQKTSLDKLVKDFKRQLNEAGFLTKGSDFTLALHLVGVGDGYFKTFEHMDGLLDRFSEFDEFKKLVSAELREHFSKKLKDEIEDAVESLEYDRDQLSYELDCATSKINELEAELKALKEGK